MSLEQRIKVMLVESLKLNRDPESIPSDAPLFQAGGLGLDSLDALQLAVSVEETFGVPIGDEGVGKIAFRSVAALAEFLRGKAVT